MQVLKKPKTITVERTPLFAGNKGFTVSDMLPLGLTIVVLGVGLALGLQVLSDFKSEQTTDSAAYNGTASAEEGITKFTTYLPTISLVIIVAVIIGILVRYLFMRAK